jgi:hypothetical protein
MNNVVGIRGAQAAAKSERASMETLILTPEMIGKWLVPPCQRPVKINAKVQMLAVEIKQDEVVPGIITLGRLKSSTALYVVDGQHRLEAFKISGLKEAICDIRIVHFDSMADLAEEFVELNSALVKMQPDDILRGLEATTKVLRRIKAECGYVGYDNIRRGGNNAPIVSMSVLLRCWNGSAADTPVSSQTGRTGALIAKEMDDESLAHLLRFLDLAFEAWGRDNEYRRLWGALNMSMCMWLYRRLVIDKQRGLKRYAVLTDPQFKQCLMSLSADSTYVDWLQGRMMGERDRSPCYTHLRRIFAKRLHDEGNAKAQMPSPAWSSNTVRKVTS